MNKRVEHRAVVTFGLDCSMSLFGDGGIPGGYVILANSFSNGMKNSFLQTRVRSN